MIKLSTLENGHLITIGDAASLASLGGTKPP